ncbi:hypothetical protein FQA39_LY10775 [Lamprigera yunnana]|nr:hypothetical protein FQA39_LY10775 [Lamprigera yunnana]
MNLLITTILSLCVMVCGQPDTYAEEFDHIDIDEILASKRLVDNYFNCIKTGQKCTPDGFKLRDLLPEVLKTKCAKCTGSQKEKAEKILLWSIQNRPDDFLQVESQFDPEHLFRNLDDKYSTVHHLTNMNQLFVLSFFVVIAYVCARPDTYTDEFDHIDVDEILSNPRLIDNYVHCLKTGQKCTPDGLKAREILPDALSTKCTKCTDVQKENAHKILEWASQHRPDDFLEIEAQFDPDHHYRRDYEDELNKRNIHLPSLK